MNTVDDLRATLAVHAPAEDTDLLDRAASVRSRVRVVRRRRRVGAAVGAVAAIAVVAAVVAVPRLAEDHVGPATTSVTAFGFDYSLEDTFRSKPGEKTLAVDLPASGEDRVMVVEAEDLDRGTVALYSVASGQEPESRRLMDRLSGDGSGGPVPLDANQADDGTPHSYLLEVEGGGTRTRVGLSVYRRSDVMPDGVVDPTGAAVFRQRMGGDELVDAAFVAPGKARATVTFDGAMSDVRIADFCSVTDGDPSSVGISVEVDGVENSGGDCTQALGPDAGGSSTRALEESARSRHTVSVTVTERNGGPPTTQEVIAGIAVYRLGKEVQVHDVGVPEIVEYAGRTWRLDRTVESQGDSIRMTKHDAQHALVGYVVDGTLEVAEGGTGSMLQTGFHDRLEVTRTSLTQAAVLSGVMMPGDGTYTVSWSPSATASGAILVYRLLK